MNRLGEHSQADRIFHRCRGESEQGLHPERDLADRQIAALRQFHAEPLAEHLEVLARPVRGDGVRVVKIEGLDRPGPQRRERALRGPGTGTSPELTSGCSAAANSRRATRSSTHSPPEAGSGRSRRRNVSSITVDASIWQPNAACSGMNSWVDPSWCWMRESRWVLPWPARGARRRMQRPGFSTGTAENVGQNLIRLAVHRLRMGGRRAPEGFEKHLERVFVGHGD